MVKYTQFQILDAFCHAMEWEPSQKAIYQKFVDVSVEYMECDAAHLHLLDLSGHFLEHSVFRGDQDDSSQYSITLDKSVGRIALMFENRELIIMDDYEHPNVEDEIPHEALDAGFKSAVSIPLYTSSGVLGILSLIYKTPLPWNYDDHDFLLKIGSVLGLFIERLQMQKKDLELRVLRERKQLSSEIHDNLSQMVSALAIRADIAQDCLSKDDLSGTQRELKEMGSQSRQITKVLREEMLSLRTPAEAIEDLTTTLRSLLQRFEEQWNIDVDLQINCDPTIQISQYAMLQLIRIVNEALQNILRHSRADRVESHVSRRNGHVVITIADNGIGFDQGSVAPERLGIRIMQERAESADGLLTISSGNMGTIITLELPVIRT